VENKNSKMWYHILSYLACCEIPFENGWMLMSTTVYGYMDLQFQVSDNTNAVAYCLENCHLITCVRKARNGGRIGFGDRRSTGLQYMRRTDNITLNTTNSTTTNTTNTNTINNNNYGYGIIKYE
jgi:hypothetical protein